VLGKREGECGHQRQATIMRLSTSMMMMIELVGGGRFRWPRYSEGLAVVCLKTVGIKMEESAKEGSDGEVRWMDGWIGR